MELMPPLPDENIPYAFAAHFNLECQEKPLKIKLTAQGLCPRIRISQYTLNFGECAVNDWKDNILLVENKNSNMDIDVVFPKLAQYKIYPERQHLKKNGIMQFTVTFKPNNLGNFNR